MAQGKKVRGADVIYAPPEELEKKADAQPDLLPLGKIEKPLGAPSRTLTWGFIGPRPVLNEYYSSGSASGRVSSILTDPTDPNLVYLAAAGGGVWKTTDGGSKWTPIGEDQLSSLSSGALAFGYADPTTIYYATGEQHNTVDDLPGDGLFKSSDSGATWAKISPTADVGSFIARVLVTHSENDILHVCSNRGYVRSIDDGRTWQRGDSTPPNAWCNDLVAGSDPDESTLFAAFNSMGIYKSTNDGLTWIQLSGLPVGQFGRINLAISPTNSDIVYASLVSIIPASLGRLLGMYKTTDGGGNWVRLPNTPDYLCGGGYFHNTLIVDISDPDIVYAGGRFPFGGSCNHGLIKTTDGGNSWTDITRGQDRSQLHPNQHTLAWGPSGTLWVGNDGGVWKTSDGGRTWINRNDTLGITEFRTVALHPTNPNFLLGGAQDNGSVRLDGRLGWPQVRAGTGGPPAIDKINPNIYYTNDIRLRDLLRWNNGVFERDITGPWVQAGERVGYANGALVADPNMANTLLAGTYRVWRTTNGGTNWQILGNAGTDLTGGSGYLRTIAVARGNSNIIYTGSSNGRVYVTVDGGTNWNLRNAGLPPGAIPDIVLGLEAGQWQTAYLCVDHPDPGLPLSDKVGRVWKTTDAGSNWQDITGNLLSVLPGARGMSLAVNFKTDPPTLYLGTQVGVYSSVDGGTSWVKEDATLPNVAVHQLRFDHANKLLLAATYGRGIWRSAVIPDRIGPYGAYAYAIATDPFNPNQVFVGAQSGGVFKSADRGETWRDFGFLGLTQRDVRALITDPNNPGTLYAGTFGGGIFKSIDGGISWFAASRGLGPRDGRDGRVLSLAMAPSNSDRLYVSMGLPGGGFFRTSNGGQTWVLVNTFAPDRIAVDPINADTVYIGGFSSILKSTNAGLTWTQYNLPNDAGSVVSLVIDPLAPNPIYAGTGAHPTRGGVFKSLDGGRTWSAANSGLPTRDIRSLAIDPNDTRTLYATALTVPLTRGVRVFKSLDGGGSWSPAGPVLYDGRIGTGPSLGNTPIAVTPNDSNMVYVSAGQRGGGLFRSTDGGTSWSETNQGFSNLSVPYILINPIDPNTIYAGIYNNRWSVFKTVNRGESWTGSAESSLINSGPLPLVIDRTNPSILYALPFVRDSENPKLYKTENGGISWSAIDFTTYLFRVGLQFVAELDRGEVSEALREQFRQSRWPLTPPIQVGVIRAGSEWRISDADPTRSFYVRNDGGGLNVYNVIRQVHSVAAGSPQIVLPDITYDTVYVAAERGVFKSANRGVSWSCAYADGRCPSDFDRNIFTRQLIIDPNSPDTIFEVVSYVLFGGTRVRKSTNGGRDWQNIGDFGRGSVSIATRDSSTIYIGHNPEGRGRVLKSTNGGQQWSDTGLRTQNNVTALVIDPQEDGGIYAGTEGDGVFYLSFGEGAQWTARNDGLSNLSVTSLAIDPTDRFRIYAGTDSNSIYVSNNGGLTWDP